MIQGDIRRMDWNPQLRRATEPALADYRRCRHMAKGVRQADKLEFISVAPAMAACVGGS